MHAEPHKAKYMNMNPKVGRKIIQYCLGSMGGRLFKCTELTAQAAVKKAPVIARFEDKEDAEIDTGFDYIMQRGPRSASESQQLPWQTKALRNTESPICGWPIGLVDLVDKALRNLPSDGLWHAKKRNVPFPSRTTSTTHGSKTCWRAFGISTSPLSSCLARPVWVRALWRAQFCSVEQG